MKKNYNGMTIVEVLVSISIFTMGIAGFTLLFKNSWQSNKYTLEMGQVSMAASQGVNQIVRYLREVRQSDNGSYPVVSANDNDLVVYCDYDRDGVTERVHIYRSGSDVILGAREPSSGFPVSYAAGDATTQVIVQRVVNAANNPIFAYYDSSYPEDSVNNPIPTPATVPNVRLVRVTLHVNIDPNNAPEHVQIQSFAEMRNLNDHDRFGI